MNAAIGAGVLVVALVVGLAVVGVGGFMTTSTSISSEATAIVMPPADGSHGVVSAKYQAESGFSVFGWNITPSRWEVQVMFVPPADCHERDDEMVVADGPCAGIPAEGLLSGGGTDGEGNRLWTVSFEVSEECHNALEYNDAWPTTKLECAPA